MLLAALPVVSLAPAASGNGTNSLAGPAHYPLPSRAASAISGAFSFVSNFEDGLLDGWASISGTPPVVTSSPSFSGEPVLSSLASSTIPQVDTANKGFITGDSLISFQVAISAGSGTGFFGLGDQKKPVALVGVSKGDVVAGASAGSLVSLGPVPKGTSYPKGWVYLAANINSTSAGWVMSVFIDNSKVVTETLNVPAAGGYTDAIIMTTSGSVSYTDIVVMSYPIPLVIPGYNNMEGYGQGSGLLVSLLPAYYNLTGQMTLDSWNTPQRAILSFQINAMNSTGTTESTCAGFFQLGIDIDPKGTIQPWYVPGVDCESTWFAPHPTATPPGSHLVLSIVDDWVAKKIRFTIADTTIGQTFTTSIPYRGSLFFSTYTQLEFQPCCNRYPIRDYQFTGSLYGLQITTKDGKTAGLTGGYMLPFILDTPPSWDFTYYQTVISGYQQIS